MHLDLQLLKTNKTEIAYPVIIEISDKFQHTTYLAIVCWKLWCEGFGLQKIMDVKQSLKILIYWFCVNDIHPTPDLQMFLENHLLIENA